MRRALVIGGCFLLVVVVLGIVLNLGWHTHTTRTPVPPPAGQP